MTMRETRATNPDAAESMVRSIQSFFNLKPNDPILLVAIGTIDGERNSVSIITANCLLREEESKEQEP